jgi:hypothetical protein
MDPSRNNVVCTLVAGITSGATSMQLTPGDAARLPNPATEGPFNLALYDSTTYPYASDDANLEYVRVTAVAGEVCTITRGQEGTAAVAHNTGGKVYKAAMVWTAKSIAEIPFVLEGVLIGATGRCQINDVRLTVNSRGCVSPGLNASGNGIQGQINVVEHGNGYVVVESEGAEVNDKNICVIIYKR